MKNVLNPNVQVILKFGLSYSILSKNAKDGYVFDKFVEWH